MEVIQILKENSGFGSDLGNLSRVDIPHDEWKDCTYYNLARKLASPGPLRLTQNLLSGRISCFQLSKQFFLCRCLQVLSSLTFGTRHFSSFRYEMQTFSSWLGRQCPRYQFLTNGIPCALRILPGRRPYGSGATRGLCHQPWVHFLCP